MLHILKLHVCVSPAEKCECKEQALTNSKLFCTMNYAYGKNANVISFFLMFIFSFVLCPKNIAMFWFIT